MYIHFLISKSTNIIWCNNLVLLLLKWKKCAELWSDNSSVQNKVSSRRCPRKSRTSACIWLHQKKKRMLGLAWTFWSPTPGIGGLTPRESSLMITLVNAKPFLFLSIFPFFFKRFIYVLVVECSIMVGKWDYTREENKLYKDMNSF